ncbi:MAG: alanine racemase [Candidatus Melainabacteria bacterium GWF2_37_15]|nr:MAG: alanine racemase [Candidatus Melainabacteria bacterium GWF2_37_15]
MVQTRRDAWVEIDLGCIEQNIKIIKNCVSPGTKILAVVKADAYGHGSSMITPTLVASGVDMLGVASVDEGIELRKGGITLPIIVLGVTPEWAITSAVENDIIVSIFTREHVNACIYAYKKLKKKPCVHIKVDTGMHRIGISCDDAPAFIKEVASIEEIQLEGIFSHLACAENKQITMKQNTLFQNVINKVENTDKYKIHLVNTAGMLAYKELHYDVVRAGIGIYGLVPGFKQVMSLKGRITHIKELVPDCGISYEYSFITKKNAKIATIPIGYADGVSRNLSNKIYGIVKGRKVKQVGNITMDQMMFDVTGINDIKTGDIITLLGAADGECIPISDWAEKLNTINYEIACRLRVRLPRVYTRSS